MYRYLLAIQIRIVMIKITAHTRRVADPVHFRPDPDPENLNFKNRIRILLALTKISLNIFMLIFLPEKMENFTCFVLKSPFC